MEAILEDQNIKRGIDFANRIGVNTSDVVADHPANKEYGILTLIFISTVFILNLFFIFPLFQLNLSPSFSSSAMLNALANFFSNASILGRDEFFLAISMIALASAPVTFYFLVRHNVLGNDFVSFLATLLYILPNPIFKDGFPLLGGLLIGDGAHAVAFAFVPLVVLIMQFFLSSGTVVYGVIAAVATAFISILSPFTIFNLILIFSILTIAEGFLGHVRIKFARMFFVLIFAFALSFFWYFPGIINQIVPLDYIKLTYFKTLNMLPVAIPAIPILGIVLFLVFYRKSKLKPYFVGVSLVILYFSLFAVSKTINITGIFTAQRYLIELSFVSCFAVALAINPVAKVLIKNYIQTLHSMPVYTGITLFCGILVMAIGVSSLSGVKAAQQEISRSQIVQSPNSGVGAITSIFGNLENSIVIGGSISIVTLFILLFILIKYRFILTVKEEPGVPSLNR